MFLRSTVLAVGLFSGLCAAQFPAYSQQYMQRLGGAVQALSEVVNDFDTSAAALGLTRSEALAEMRGTAFVEARRVDIQRTFDRHDALSADMTALQGQGPFMRAYRIRHMVDAELARGAWNSFEPALPLTLAGAVFALLGFVAGSAVCRLALRLCRLDRRQSALAS